MVCPREPDVLSAYVDGELRADERQLTADHLAVCPTCAREAAGLRAARSRLASQGLVEAPVGFWARVSRALDIADTVASEVLAPRVPPVWVLRTARLAPSVVCLLLLVGAMYHQYTKSEPGATQVAQLARAHSELAREKAAPLPLLTAASGGVGTCLGSRRWALADKPVEQVLFQRGLHTVSVFEMDANDFDPGGLVPHYGWPSVVMTGQSGGVNMAACRQGDKTAYAELTTNKAGVSFHVGR